MRISRISMVYVFFVSVLVTKIHSQDANPRNRRSVECDERSVDSHHWCGSCDCRPTMTCGPVSSCDCAEIQEIVSSQLSDMKDQLRLLQRNIPQGSDDVFLPKDCSEVLSRGITHSGLHKIQPLDFGRPLRVYCDMDTDGGGWTVFQRRQDGSVDFYQSFASYRRGFGEPDGEFWLGNDNLHRLTAQDEYELRIDLSDTDDSSRHAIYDSFDVGDVNSNYWLTIGAYTGTAGDSLSYHHNMAFTTKDRDYDNNASNCAKTFHGGWWFDSCQQCNLNGDYFGGGGDLGMVWKNWNGGALKTSEMKFRMKM